MDISNKYLEIDDLKKLIETKRHELFTLDCMSVYPFGIQDSLTRQLNIMKITRELIILQEALIFRQNEILKGINFPYNKK